MELLINDTYKGGGGGQRPLLSTPYPKFESGQNKKWTKVDKIQIENYTTLHFHVKH